MSNFNNNNLKALITAMLAVDKAERAYAGAVAALIPHMKASDTNRKAIFEAIAKHYGIATGPSERDNEWGNVTLKKGDDLDGFKRAENRWEYVKKAWRNATPSKDTAKPAVDTATDPVASLLKRIERDFGKMTKAQRNKVQKAVAAM